MILLQSARKLVGGQVEPAPERGPQGDSPGERVAHGAHDRQIVGRPGCRVAGPHHFLLVAAQEDVAFQPRQLQVVEENLQELLARECKDEVVLGLAGACLAAVPPAILRTRNAVAFHELAIAGRDDLAIAAGPMAKDRLGNVLARNPDVAALLHVLHGALGQDIVHRPADLLAVAAQKAGAIDGALVSAVLAPVDYVSHGTAVTKTCAPAGTSRTAGALASPCSLWPPCARRSFRA